MRRNVSGEIPVLSQCLPNPMRRSVSGGLPVLSQCIPNTMRRSGHLAAHYLGRGKACKSGECWKGSVDSAVHPLNDVESTTTLPRVRRPTRYLPIPDYSFTLYLCASTPIHLYNRPQSPWSRSWSRTRASPFFPQHGTRGDGSPSRSWAGAGAGACAGAWAGAGAGAEAEAGAQARSSPSP
jgi:hypothetical protein